MEARAPSPVQLWAITELTAARARAPAPPQSHLEDENGSMELEDIAAQILVLHDVSQRFADILGIHSDLLALSSPAQRS